MVRTKATSSQRSKTAVDFLQLDASQAPPGGLADWLGEQLRLAVADGRLARGSRLPPTRSLAAELGVSRGVVTEAYRRLAEDGHVAGRGRAGTVVVGTAVVGTAVVGRPARPVPLEPSPPERADGGNPFAGPPDIEVFEAVRAAPASIDLAPGVPDLDAFPRAAWLRAERIVLRELPSAELGYGDPSGTTALKLAVTHWLARTRGIRVEPGEVIITAGVSQALALAAQVLAASGLDRIAVEDPGSFGSRSHLQSWGMATPPVPVDDRGLLVDQLAATGARAVLLTPAHQFPTGVVMDGDRRRELMAWAAGGGLVIEDDYDAEHRYDRPPVPALRSLDPHQVIYTGSVSKLLAPALRIGWLIAPDRWRERLFSAKRIADLGTSALPQLVLARLMDSGELERQLRLVRRRHRERRDAMLAALAAYVPAAVVHGAAAGLHLTITLPDGVDDTAVASAAMARGVKVHPLSWHAQRSFPPGLVLGYAASTPTEISDGVKIVGAALSAAG